MSAACPGQGDAARRVALLLGTSVGGVGRHVRMLAGGLATRGHEVVVVGPPATEELFGFTTTGARFVALPVADRPRPAHDAHAVWLLRSLLRDSDVVHAHGLRMGALAGLALAGRCRPPLVVTLHNAPLAGGAVGVWFAALERVVARRATLVLGVSGDLQARMARRGARRVVRALVPAPLPGDAGRPSAGETSHTRAEVRAELEVDDRPLIVVAARLAPQKGLHTLLDAAAGWARRDPPPLVALAGEGPLGEELAHRIAVEELPVRLLGPRDDVADLLAAADVVVVPSLWEGQPLVVQEALRARAPLVATAVGGIVEMVDDAALLVPPADAGALESAVSHVLDDDGLARRLRTAAAAVKLPTEADAIAQVLAIYRDLALNGYER